MKVILLFLFSLSIFPCENYKLKLLGGLEEPLLEETSGIAVSRKHSNIVWAHNDSGDEARFFAFTKSGKARGQFKISGAKHIDWEDMAIGKCPTFSRSSKEDCLYFGDIGDNPFKRKNIVIYIVKEPKPSKDNKTVEVNLFHQYEVTLDTKARNFETMVVDKNKIVLISKSDARAGKKYKEEGNSHLYKFTMSKKKKVSAEKFSSLNLFDLDGFKRKKDEKWQNYFGWLTAGDYDSESKKLYLLTYGLLLEYKVADWKKLELVGTFELPKMPQAESVAIMRNGSALVVSEYSHQPLYEIACQN